MEGKTPVPEKESIASFAEHGATMVLFLSSGMIPKLREELLKGAYTEDTPVAIVYKATWPDQKVIRCTLRDMAEQAEAAHISRLALIMVGDFLGKEYDRSLLYHPGFTTGYREASE
jgi:precorrin-4/cobalt-precorrin-4 C11-methyltransferase